MQCAALHRRRSVSISAGTGFLLDSKVEFQELVVTCGALAVLAKSSHSLPRGWKGWSWSLLGAQGKGSPLSQPLEDFHHRDVGAVVSSGRPERQPDPRCADTGMELAFMGEGWGGSGCTHAAWERSCRASLGIASQPGQGGRGFSWSRTT